MALQRDSVAVFVDGAVADSHIRIMKRICSGLTTEYRERQACITRSDRVRLKRKKVAKRIAKAAARLGAG